ncbi:claudin domain-containing protein 2 isoform X3 [Panthera pardus]|uniref:Claudin domain-containing protein 2 isoform X3 n=1 Tax=Panthera pardus TaxID=9691 RepID=A0A9W2VSR7_PANPR|nr:claudin domain-containing protein 2 isoform X3 [Panthera pardus]
MAASAPTSPARVRPRPPRCPPLDRQHPPPPPPALSPAGPSPHTTAGHILRRPHPHPFLSSLRSTCSSATKTTTNPHFGICFPVGTLTAPHEATCESLSKLDRRVGVVARGGTGARLRRPLPPAMLAVAGACMVLAACSAVVGLVMGLRILYHEGDSRGQTMSGTFFLCGFCFLLADMIVQSTDAISGFPVCL